MSLAMVPQLQDKFLAKLESKIGTHKAISPAVVKKVLSFFDTNQDGWITMPQFMQALDQKLDEEEAAFLYM